jgi:hypothetical protein
MLSKQSKVKIDATRKSTTNWANQDLDMFIKLKQLAVQTFEQNVQLHKSQNKAKVALVTSHDIELSDEQSSQDDSFPQNEQPGNA